MTRRTVRLMQELPLFLRACSEQELYEHARCLRHELVRRGKPAALVADELAELLLLDARIEHRQIFSAAWGPDPLTVAEAAEAFMQERDAARDAAEQS